MRVLHVIAGNLWGGIESFLVTLARSAELAPGMRSEFAVCFDGRLRRDLVALGAPTVDLGPVRTRSPWSVLRGRQRLRRQLRATKYDVVVCHSAWTQAIFGTVPRQVGVPLVFYLHDLVRAKYWLERWASLHRPEFAVVNSQFTGQSLPALFHGVPSSVIHYPIELRPEPLTASDRAALRREIGAGEQTVVIVQASRMQPWKGHARLLRALASIHPKTPWLCLEVGGAQRDEERTYVAGLERLSRELGIGDRVRFLGQRADVPRLLGACDIHCQSNASPEPFGIVFIEALAAGLPVLTFDMGGAREIVTAEVGYLAADDAALADQLLRWIDDPLLRQQLGAAGPARARELCDPARQLAALERAFRGVAAATG